MNQHLNSDLTITQFALSRYGMGFYVSNHPQYDGSLRFRPNQIQPHSNAYLSNFRFDALGQIGQAEH